MEELTRRQRYLRRLADLRSEQSTWVQHWRDLTEQIQPRSSRFVAGDRNRGDKRNQHIINGTPTWAARVLASGMMAGITSPARPWFRLGTPDPELQEYGPVRSWLHVVEERVRLALARGGVYNCLHQLYGDLAVPGTAALYIEEDPVRLIRASTFPIGQFYLANGADGRVNSIYREFSMTVAQLVEKFTLEKCSQRVQNLYETKKLDTWIEVCHAIEPNLAARKDMGPAAMPWASCWFETAGGTGSDAAQGELKVAGYEEFPAMCPRWSVTSGEDVYGSSPGMEALGDCRALQSLEKRGAQAFDKIVSPPMNGPSSLYGQASLLPGALNVLDSMAPGQTFAPSITVNPQAIPAVEAKIREHESRIKQAFYADLWLMLSAGEQSPERTAREVSELHEEKMLQLGPVVERMQGELLDPLIDRVFGILLRNGYLPDPPEELQGHELRVEYISIMAQAQKLLGTSSVERLSSFVGNLAAVKPEILDKLDFDQMVDEYGNMLGVPPDLIRSDEQVRAIRDARAQQQQQAAAAQAAAQTVQGAQVLSQTDTSGDNALTRMLGALGGPAVAATGGGAR